MTFCLINLRINTDASFKNGKAFGALAARNAGGSMLFFQSRQFLCSSPFEAELETLEWAVCNENINIWDRIEWSVDAKQVFESITSTGEGGWNTHFKIKNIKMRFENPRWKLKWHPRSTNNLADAIAKTSRICNISFFFSVSSPSAYPELFYRIATSDRCNSLHGWGNHAMGANTLN